MTWIILALAAGGLLAVPTIAMWWPMRCLYLRWHRIIRRSKLSEVAEKLTCSCGKEYAINHDMRVCLPWESVRSFYEERDKRFPRAN